MYTNIDGINATKGGEMNVVIQTEEPDIIFITESKLSNGALLAQFIDCQNFNIYRKDRSHGYGGGVLIMVKNNLPVIELYDGWEDIEAVVCRIRMEPKWVNVACMYRPPASSSSYNESVRLAIRRLSAGLQGQLLICGDFNFKEINWHIKDVHGGENSEQAKFLDECENCFLHQHVVEFTRSRGTDQPSTLDLVFSRDELEVDNLEYKPPIGSSDHCVLAFEFRIDV